MVSDGQLANQTTFNNAFVSRTADDNTVGKKDLQNTDPVSGPGVINAQREINSLNSFTGRPSGSVFDETPNWVSTQVGTTTDNLEERGEALTVKFDQATGHSHDGTLGEGPLLNAGNALDNINLLFAEYQYFEVTGASGTSTVVTSTFTGQVPGGSSVAAGVLTTAPSNRVSIISLSTGTAIEDAGGQRVYGRITESSGVWTLSFFTNESGVETAHSLASTNIGVFYRQVFNQADRPTIPADVAEIGSLDLTADIVDASPTQRGLVSTGTQTLAGAKTFNGNLRAVSELATTSYNDATSAPGTVATANKSEIRLTSATLGTLQGLSGGTDGKFLTLINASGATVTVSNQNGTASAADRIITGTGLDFTFVDTAAAIFNYDATTQRWRLLSGSGGLNTVGTFGSTPNAQGASITGNTLTLQPASGTHPGGVSTTTQVFQGYKTFNSEISLIGSVYFNRVDNGSATGSNATVGRPDSTLLNLTNASLVSVDGIVSPSIGPQAIVMTNLTGASITINDETGATAGNRIRTGSGAAITVANNASIWLIYNLNTSRWYVVGGSGGGSSTPTIFGSRGTPRSVVAATGITSGASHMSTLSASQDIYVEGSIAGDSVCATITAGTIDGQRMTIIGRNDSQTLTFDSTTTNVYVNGSVTLGANQLLNLRWDTSAWVQI